MGLEAVPVPQGVINMEDVEAAPLVGVSTVMTLEYGTDDSNLKRVPAWALNQEAMQVKHKEFGAFVVGPAVRTTYKATIVSGTVWILTPLIAYFSASCGADGLAHVPYLVYLLPATTLVYMIWLEWKVRSYTVIPQLIRARE